MRFSSSLTIGLLCSLALFTVACDRNPSNTPPKDGATTGWTVPSDWPKDLPVYPGAKISTSAAFNPDSTKPGSMLSMETSDTPKQVSAFYAKALKDNGWTVDGITDGGKYTAVMCTKAARMATVHATTSDGKLTSILIATGEK